MTVTVSKKVPLFKAASTAGETSLASLVGRKVVLYFYPKDNTPGCTTEAGDFRDRHPDFEAAGATILGVSRDTLRSHQSFKAKLDLPFELIADPDETLCSLFDVVRMKNMYGKAVRGIVRSTFLIDAQGILVREWRGARVPGHVDEVLAAARSLD